MAQYLNAAAFESWRKMKEMVDRSLENAMRNSGIGRHEAASILSSISQNASDVEFDEEDSDHHPKRIKGIR